MRVPRTALFSLALLAALAFAPSAAALTREQANEIALGTLQPELEAGPVILFGLPQALGPRQSVIEAGPSRLGNVPAKGLPKLKKKTWLFWEDLYPDAFFVHPSRLLLVDDATGRVRKNAALSWYPLVDGKMPLFLLSDDGYDGPTYRVFSNVEGAAVARSLARADAFLAPLAPPPGTFKDDCLLMVGLVPQPEKADAKERDKERRISKRVRRTLSDLEDAAAAVGLPAYYATTDGPDDAPPAGNGDQVSGRSRKGDPEGRRSLSWNVDFLVKKKNCKDVWIYILGHGTPAPGTKVEGQEVKGGPPAVEVGQNKLITPDDLKFIAKQHAKDGKSPATFKIMLDVCYAERFKEPVFAEENVIFFGGATSTGEPGIIRFGDNVELKDAAGNPVTPAVPNPGRTEFGHAVVEGFKEITGSDAEFGAATKPGGSKLGQVLKALFAKMGMFNRAVKAVDKSTGKPFTTPVEMDRLPAAGSCTGERTGVTGPGRVLAPGALLFVEFRYRLVCTKPVTEYLLQALGGVQIVAWLAPSLCTISLETILSFLDALRCRASQPFPAGSAIDGNIRTDGLDEGVRGTATFEGGGTAAFDLPAAGIG